MMKDWLECRDKDLGVIEEEVRKWGRYNFPDATAEDQFFGMVEEIGEIAHAILKGRQKIREHSDGDTQKIDDGVRDGIGDLLIFLINYCDREGWNMLEILQDTWAVVRLRDWIKYPENGLDK